MIVVSKQEKQTIKALENVNPGDLIAVEWCHASVGKSSGSGMAIEVPVKSWGIFVGLIGDRVKHIILAQNSFRYADRLYDLDYTAIPIGWAVDAAVLVKEHLPTKTACKLVNSFLLGGHRAFNQVRIFQRRLRTHGRLR